MWRFDDQPIKRELLLLTLRRIAVFNKSLFTTLFLIFVLTYYSLVTAQEIGDLMDMSLEDLANIEITTASNRSEKLSEAPSTLIVITKDDIMNRGYFNLIDVLIDLPGMDVIVSYGDDYVRNYWRGFRNNISAPYLLMIDGVMFNQLYLNSAGILATFPLSNVERIEFVYGPASSVYGANAFMGVVNIITNKNVNASGSNMYAKMVGGSNDRIIGDFNMFYKKDDLRISLTARFENGNARGDDVFNNFEYTKDKYYKDRALWGNFVDNPNTGGKFSSPIKNRGVDIRSYYGNTTQSTANFWCTVSPRIDIN